MINIKKISIKKKLKTVQKLLELQKSEILTCSSSFASCIAREGADYAYLLRIANEWS
jgi:hypothetical protein